MMSDEKDQQQPASPIGDTAMEIENKVTAPIAQQQQKEELVGSLATAGQKPSEEASFSSSCTNFICPFTFRLQTVPTISANSH